MTKVIEALAHGEKVSIPVCLTRKQVVRLYQKKEVSFTRKGDRFVLRHKEDKALLRLEARIKRDKALLAEYKSGR